MSEVRVRVQARWLPWLSIGLLALLCAVFGFFQFRWIGDIAAAERARLEEELQSRLTACGHAFNENVSSALREMIPPASQVVRLGRDAAWSDQYLRWKRAHGHLLERAGIESRGDLAAAFRNLDLQSGRLALAERPDTADPAVLELATQLPNEDTLIVQLDLKYLQGTLLPQINSCMAASGKLDYDIEVVTNGYLGKLIYASFPGAQTIWTKVDASSPLLDLRPDGLPERTGRLDKSAPAPPAREERRSFFFASRTPAVPPSFGPGRWHLLVRHKSGSLEALVAREQARNLTVSAGILLLILGTVAMLIRYTRQAQHLAELQMNFVAGISHELRTPLTVIRTAAWNLRTSRLRRSEDQIENYWKLIENETEKLQSFVEQVMRFASAKAGHAIRNREPLLVADLIEAEIAGLRSVMESKGVVLEKSIELGLPVVLADGGALRQALRNLLENALKYGVAKTRWIGVYARTIDVPGGKAAEICIADRGPGIPKEEQSRIFNAFFRGTRATRDQVHGTGLGLSLVKTIVEAHQGGVDVRSDVATGSRFIVWIPAAPPEFQTGAAI